MGLLDALDTKPPDTPTNPWEMLTRPSEQWDVDAMYTVQRGSRVSDVPHVMLATPAYNAPCLEFLHSRELVVQDLIMAGIPSTTLTSPGDSLVMRGRHTLMHAFLMLSRKAIVMLCEKHPELLYFSDLPSGFGEPMWALFDTALVNRRFLSEDYFFCKLWRDLGGQVHVFVPFEARHWGRKGFEASFMAAMNMREP